MNTQLLYMNDFYLFEASAKVVSVSENEDGKKTVVLDQTIFYPQGGGQRFDTGIISNNSAIFNVEEVRFVEGKVLHIGNYKNGEFTIGDDVKLEVDKNRRILHSKLQSAGHLIDAAVRNIGYTELKPTKGAHYPEWSQVEYEGTIPPEAINSATQKLQAELDAMISRGHEVKTEMSSKDDVQKKCYIFPPELSTNLFVS